MKNHAIVLFLALISINNFAITLKDLKKSSRLFTQTFNYYSKKFSNKKIEIKIGDFPMIAESDYNDKKNIILVSKNILSLLDHLAEFDQILCHELGHMIGKGPQDSRLKMTKHGKRQRQAFLAEGQAEYFSSFCLKTLWKKNSTNLNSLKRIMSEKYPKENLVIKKLCRLKDIAKCEEILITHFLTKNKMALNMGITDLSYLKKDPRKPDFTIQGIAVYPHPYCLLENALNSTMCGDSLPSIVMTGECSEETYERPACWYYSE